MNILKTAEKVIVRAMYRVRLMDSGNIKYFKENLDWLAKIKNMCCYDCILKKRCNTYRVISICKM